MVAFSATADAQGFLGKLKQKAQQAVIGKKATAEISEAAQDESDEPADPSKLAVAEKMARSTRLYCYADIAYYYFSITSAG